MRKTAEQTRLGFVLRGVVNTYASAIAAVARCDRVMSKLIDRTALFHLPRPGSSHFAALTESILYQQLAGAAAAWCQRWCHTFRRAQARAMAFGTTHHRNTTASAGMRWPCRMTNRELYH